MSHEKGEKQDQDLVKHGGGREGGTAVTRRLELLPLPGDTTEGLGERKKKCARAAPHGNGKRDVALGRPQLVALCEELHWGNQRPKARRLEANNTR